MKTRYPICPPEEPQKNRRKKRPRPSYDEAWRERLAGEETGEINQQIYPEETEDSPLGRRPEEISNRKNLFNVAQSELAGHLFIPYYHLPPKGARFWDSIDTRTVNAGVTATVIASTTLDLQNGVLRWFGNELTDTTGYPNVSWTIFINGVAFGPWNGITLSLGAINSPSLIFIPLILSDTFSVDATNNSGSTNYVVRTRIKGWRW